MLVRTFRTLDALGPEVGNRAGCATRGRQRKETAHALLCQTDAIRIDGPAGELDRLLQERRVLTCGPVAAELLAGARGAEADQLGSALRALPWAPLDQAAWIAVGAAAATLRARGEMVPLTDIEIAVSAHRAEAVLWSRDSDFERVARSLPGLRVVTEA